MSFLNDSRNKTVKKK